MENHQYTCPFSECGKSFKARKSLVEHMRIHKGEKPYKCHYPGCEKCFTQYSSMQKHERTHTGDKPYKCTICDKDFTQVSNLKRHERVHAGEKPHECDICQKKFSTASNLKQHIHVHEKGDIREKYFCEICNKTYLYRSSLRKHLQEHEEQGFLISTKDSDSTKEGSLSENLYTQTKIEPEFEIHQANEKNRRKAEKIEEEEEEEAMYQEPELSKYIFIDGANVVKSSPIDFKCEYEARSLLEENPKSPDLQQAPSPKENTNVFPDSPSAYLYKPDYDADSNADSKLLPLTPLIGSPLRDLPFANNSSDYQFLSIKPKTTSNIIRYKGELYYLYDRTLNRTKHNGELIIRQIDNDAMNPSGCHHLPEVSHYPDYHSLIQVYQEIVSKSGGNLTLEMLLSDKNCNSLNSNSGSGHRECKEFSHGAHNHDSEFTSMLNIDKFLSSPKLSFQDEFLSNNPLEANFTNEEKPRGQSDHVCLCKITRDYKHVHGSNCGHQAIWHDGHLDYIVDGKLHHPDGDHCDDHGPICIVDNASEDFTYGLISNIAYSDTKFKPAPLLSDSFKRSIYE